MVGFEMLTIFHGASPDSEMFASDWFISTKPWKGQLPPHISCVRRVRHFLPLVQWIKTHSFIGHSDGHPAQFATTTSSVCSGRAMPCCGKLCRLRHACPKGPCPLYPQRTDIAQRERHVRKVPTGDMLKRQLRRPYIVDIQLFRH